MAENIEYVKLSGRMKSVAKDKVLAETNSIFDEKAGKFQEDINTHAIDAINLLEDTDTVLIKTKGGLRKINATDLRKYATYDTIVEEIITE